MSRTRLIVALALFAAAGGWLAATAEPPPGPDWWYFFGLWRTRTILLALAAAWLGLAFLFAAFSRRLVFAQVFATLLLLLTVGGLEAAGRVGLVHYPRLFGMGGEVLGKKRLPHVDVSGETWPDTAAALQIPSEPIPFRYRTDHHGLRNAVDRDEADVYLLGDSFLVAGLVPFEETVPARLEAALGKPVMNVALIGIGPQAELDLLKAVDPPLDGRLVIQFVYEGNDLGDSARYRKRPPARVEDVEGTDEEEAASGGASFVNSLAIFLQRKTSGTHPSAAARIGRIGGRDYTFHSGRRQFDPYRKEVPHLLAALGAAREHVEKSGGRYAIVLVPAKLRALGPSAEFPPESEVAPVAEHLGGLPAAVAAWAAEADVPCLDLAEPLAAAAAEGRIGYYPYDTHWNAEGHRIAAGRLAEWAPVRKQGER